VAYGGHGGYKAKDCQLQSSAKVENCDGAHHNLDLYIKTDDPETPDAPIHGFLNGEEFCEGAEMLTNEDACRATSCCHWNTEEPGISSFYGSGRCWSSIGQQVCTDMPSEHEHPVASPTQIPISPTMDLSDSDMHCMDKDGSRFVNQCVLDMFAADPKQNICGPCGCSGCPLMVPELPAEAPKPTSATPTVAPTRSPTVAPTEGPVETTKRPPERPTKPELVCLDFVKAKSCKKKAKKKGLKCKWSKKKKLCTAKTKKSKDRQKKNKAD
jgi:hypothetical protein